MLWLASRDSIYAAAGAPFPGGRPAEERAVLHDGLAARRLVHASNSFAQVVSFSQQAVTLVGIAGWSVNRPLALPLQVRGRRGVAWQPYVPMTVDGSAAYATLPLPAYNGIQIDAGTGVSGTEMTFGEILIGHALVLPTPSSVDISTQIPTVVNGDYAVRVGPPLRDVRIGWPPQVARELEEWVREYGGETGLLAVDGRVVFGRLGSAVEYQRGTQHDRYAFGSVAFSEVAGESVW